MAPRPPIRRGCRVRWLMMQVRFTMCASIGHVHWTYTAGGGFCQRCVADYERYVDTVVRR
jgi:hypothetical protein